MLRRTESWSTDCSFVDDARLQQELHDLVYYAQTQKRKNALPRIDSVRFIRIGNAGQYGVSIELVLLKKNPESTSGAVQRIDVAVRIPARFPAEVPMISCTYGADNLPPELQSNGQLMVPWLQDGWPRGYLISVFASELCTAMDGSLGNIAAPEPVHPVSAQQVEEYYTVQQYCTERENNDAGKASAAAQRERELRFTCKWRTFQKSFAAYAPQTINQLVDLIKGQFSVSSDQAIILKEFHSVQTGTIIRNDEDVLRLCGRGLSTIYVIVEDVNVVPKSVDLLGLSTPSATDNQQIAVSQSSQTNQLSRLLLNGSNVRQILCSDFKVVKSIGAGSSCQVYLANWRGTDVAVKAFTGADRQAVEREFTNEVTMMNRLGCHPSLVLFLGVCPNPISIVFEYLPFSLFELINGVQEQDRQIPPFPKSWTKRVTMMLDLAKGLQFLHSFDIIHRDLKSLNILVTAEGRAKLADFGISRVAQPSKLMTGCCGTFQWMAPEVIVSESYSLSADIYSFGVILWEICEGSAPFAELAPGCVPIAVVKEKKRPQLSSTTPQPLQSLIQSCWQENATRRPSAKQAVEILQSFFPRS